MMPLRYVTHEGVIWEGDARSPESTPIAPEIQDPEAYRLYRLCECENCSGTGKTKPNVAPDVCPECGGKHFSFYAGKNRCHCGWTHVYEPGGKRCPTCRGEGRTLDLVATCGSPEAVGVALVTLTAEGEWDECPFGLMHRPEGETGKWLLKPWGPSARNVSDAGRTLARSKNPDRSS